MKRGMLRGLCAALSLLVCAAAQGRKKPQVWLEVHSPHFLVATNGSEKQARRVADQFERIRAVFLAVFPNQRVDPAAPIIVLAAKDQKSFEPLMPPSMVAKGAARRAGLFERGPEKNYVVLELDAPGENPYQTLYHEYTHLLLHQTSGPLPPWLDEGLAEFYGNSRIEKDRVELGRPDPAHVLLLRHEELLPLPTLFAATHSSPYYNESNKANIFYAESWALVHMLMSESFEQKSHPMQDYIKDLLTDPDPVRAARQAFGNLSELQKRLEKYVNQMAFRFFTLRTRTAVDDQAFTARTLRPAQADALRGDCMVYVGNFPGARTTLTRALQEDPRNASAAASLGFLEFRQRHLEAAKKWYTRAIQLDSDSYLAQYYYAMLQIRAHPQSLPGSEVGASLRKAIALNPRFAPAYDALAHFDVIRDENLEEAHRMALQAVSLDPGEVYYYLTAASVLLRLKQADNAVRVCKKALAMAKSPQELTAAQNLLASAEKFQAYLQSVKSYNQRIAAMNSAQTSLTATGGGEATDAPPMLRRRDGTPVIVRAPAGPQAVTFHSDPKLRGARDTLSGTIESVKCSLPALLEVTLKAGRQTVKLYSENYFHVRFSALNFTPPGELHPCRDLKGYKARVFFYDLKGKPNQGELISVRLRK